MQDSTPAADTDLFDPTWRRDFDADDIIEPTIDPTTKKQVFRDVVAVNFAGTRTEAKVRNFDVVATDEPATSGGTNTAPTPFEQLLVSLVGCEAAILHGVAEAMGFEYEGVDFKAGGTFDLRGPRGVAGIRPYFEEINVDIVIHTSEPDERVRQVARNVETRCPVMNLFRDAGTVVNARWRVAGRNDEISLN